MKNQMYAIQDQRTGRFLSWQSVPFADEKMDSHLYITHTGKLGTIFYKTINESVKAILKDLQTRAIGKILHIVRVDPDKLPLGERYIENLGD